MFNGRLKKKEFKEADGKRYTVTRFNSLRSQPLHVQTGIYFTGKAVHFTRSKCEGGLQEIKREINNLKKTKKNH